jgi:hypothetical protein
MLASNPSRNSRPELIADDGQGARLPERPIARPGPVDRGGRTAVTLTLGQGGCRLSSWSGRRDPGLGLPEVRTHRTGEISASLKKRMQRAPSFFFADTLVQKGEVERSTLPAGGGPEPSGDACHYKILRDRSTDMWPPPDHRRGPSTRSFVPRPTSGRRLGSRPRIWFWFWFDHIGPIDSACLPKRILGGQYSSWKR